MRDTHLNVFLGDYGKLFAEVPGKLFLRVPACSVRKLSAYVKSC